MHVVALAEVIGHREGPVAAAAVYEFAIDRFPDFAPLRVSLAVELVKAGHVNNAEEYAMSALGFNWRESQPHVVSTYYGNANRAELFNSEQVAANPALFGLYDKTSIMDYALGHLMIQKTGDTVALDLQARTSTDIASQPFTDNGLPITLQVPMPSNKSFLRVRTSSTY